MAPRTPNPDWKRQRILDYVEAHPGPTTRELSREAGMGLGTVVFHLRRLSAEGQLRSLRHGNSVRWFKRRPRDPVAAIALREAGLAHLFDYVKRHPATNQRRVLDHFEAKGWSRSTVQHRLARLVRQGLVSAAPAKRARGLAYAVVADGLDAQERAAA